jgi:Gpi18-like mannosyltransferase
MSGTLVKKPLIVGLLKFLETRLIILFIGALCFAIFPQHGQPYRQKTTQQVISLKAVWNKFDSHWYQKLAHEGYPQRAFTDEIQETWGFMPLYPLLISLLRWLFGGNLFYTGIFISNVCTLTALYIIYKLTQEKFNTGNETVSLILTCAGSFYLSIVYAEGLFILLTALVFYLTHKKHYGWALVIAGLASVTRIQGCLLFVIPGIEILNHNIRTSFKYIPALLLSVLPIVLLMFFLNQICGEPLAFLKIQHAWGSSDLFPLQGFVGLLHGNRLGSSITNTFFWIMILAIVIACYRKLPLSYVIFTLLYFLLSTSNEIVYGTTRYMLGILPLFVAVSLSSPSVKQFFIFINILFLALTISAFVTSTATFI